MSEVKGGKRDDINGSSLSISLDSFFSMVDFSLYSYDFDTLFWPCRKFISDLERIAIMVLGCW